MLTGQRKRWNWARNQCCRPQRFLRPRTTQELTRILQECHSSGSEVKVIGSTHSMSDLVCSDGYLISIDRLKQVIDIDRDSASVTVQSGMKLYRLNNVLARNGLALKTLGSTAEQTVAGAISTGTHGSCRNCGILATDVSELELIEFSGTSMRLTEASDPDRLNAVRVSLGQLGIISEIKMRCVPVSLASEKLEKLDVDFVMDNLDTFQSNEHFRLCWKPAKSMLVVQTINRIADSSDRRIGTLRPYRDRAAWGQWLVRALKKGDTLAPFERTGRSDTLFCYPRLGVRLAGLSNRLTGGKSALLNSEYAIPAEKWPDACRAIQVAARDGEISRKYPLEIRFGARDDIWLSPAYQQDTCYIGFYEKRDTSQNGNEELGAFRAFEELIRNFDARPHWGKIHFFNPEDLRRVFPMWDSFQTLRSEFSSTPNNGK
ncbi:MAG: FAD-binding protein [Planctomycetota bacterium]|nr:FAD-binding protein [Planctomycetota bacterium]